MKLKCATFNKIIILAHIIAYAAIVGFLWPRQTLLNTALSMLPPFLLLFFWKVKSPRIFLGLQLFVLSAFALVEVPQFEFYFGNFLQQIISSLSYEQGTLFFRSYLFIFTFLIFYFPIAFLLSLVNFAAQAKKPALIKISSTVAMFFCGIQLIFIGVFSKDFREILVVAVFQVVTTAILLYGYFFESGRAQLAIFDKPSS